MKKTKILFSTSLLIFLILLVLIITNARFIQSADNGMRSIVNVHRTTVWNTFFTNFTQIFNTKETLIWIVVTIVFSWIMTDQAFILQVAITLFSGMLLNRVIKVLIRRPRPSSDILMHYPSYSFPSGHSCAAALVLGCLILLTWRVGKRKWANELITVCFIGLALMVGFSRVYVGAHYPSDVLAGLCLGNAIVTGYQWLFMKYTHR